MHYGEKIKQLRKKAGLTQRELEIKLGLTESIVSSWERVAYPPLRSIEKVCKALDIELWQFFAPEDLIFPEMDKDQREIYRIFNNLPDDFQIRVMDAVIAFLKSVVKEFQ